MLSHGEGATEGASPGWAHPRTALGLQAALCTSSCPPERPGLEPPDFTEQAPTPGPSAQGWTGQPCPWRSPGTWALGIDQWREERAPPGGGCQVEAGPGTCWRGRSRDSSSRGTGGSQAVLPQENCRHGARSLHPRVWIRARTFQRHTHTHTSLLARQLGQHGRKRLWSQALAYAWPGPQEPSSLGSPLCRASWDLVTGRVAGSWAQPPPTPGAE